jgi:hypothetical protein
VSRYPLDLEGFDRNSVWGYDEPADTYFATIWRNESDSDGEPDVWLSWFTQRGEIRSPEVLARMISSRTDKSLAEVLRAMAAGMPTAERAHMTALAERMV